MWCVETSSSAARARDAPRRHTRRRRRAVGARGAVRAILREPVARCASRARYLLRDRALDLHYFEYASGEMKDIASVDELAPLLVEGSVLDFGAFDERHVTEPDRLWVELERSCGNEYVAYFGRRDETRAVRYSGARGAEAATAEGRGRGAAAAYAARDATSLVEVAASPRSRRRDRARRASPRGRWRRHRPSVG